MASKLIDLLYPPVVHQTGKGRIVPLLNPPKTSEPSPPKIRKPPRSKAMEIPDATVRLVRALRLIGLHRALVARMTGCSSESVSEYGRQLRRKSAGLPSDEEIREAGLFAAQFAITQRQE
jgi:hypothetical protein